MGIVTAFLIGYLVGANAGQEGYREVVVAARSVKDSPEFEGLLLALRSHAGATFTALGARLAPDHDVTLTPRTLLGRVQDLVGRPGATSPAS